MGLKKVLIIAYYWPPTGGGGVYRWVKFVKYLREFGWEPVVYTPLNPEAGIRDESLLKDVPNDITIIKRKIIEPYNLYKFFTGKDKTHNIDNFVEKKKGGRSGFKEKLSVRIRGNFFIPDARCMWIRPSARFLTKWLKDNPVDVIVSTGPPHSMHLIALKVSKKLNIPWLADFRDPWTGIDFYDKLKIGKLADSKHRRLERKVLTNAQLVVTVSPNWGNQLKSLGAKHVEIVNNGYDSEDFNFLPVETDKEFSITHVGSLNKDRNPVALWKSLSELCRENEKINQSLTIRFLGSVDYTVEESLKEFGLYEKAHFMGYVPHSEALNISSRSAVLLMLTNQTPNVMGIIPGKMYEYLATKRPILLVAPKDSDSENILNETKSGYRVDFDNIENMKYTVVKLFNNFIQKDFAYDEDKIIQFSRRKLTQRMAALLNKLTRSENDKDE